MALKASRDPQDPDFTHGTIGGYRRGCTKAYALVHPCPARPSCLEVKLRDKRKYPDPPPLYSATAMAAFVRELHEEGGWDYESIAQAAGLRVERLLRIMRLGTRVSLDVLRAVLSLNDEVIASRGKPKGRVPFRMARAKLRALYAQGYTLQRLSYELQADRRWLWKIMNGRENRFVLCSLYWRIFAMHEKFGQVPAPFSSGAEYARRDARLRGWTGEENVEVAA
jgi:hypothetical protein